MVLLKQLAKTYREVFPEFFKSCPNLPPLRTPIALTQKLWQNTSHVKLGGLINWFYVAIRNNNFCSTLEYLQYKIWGMTAHFAPTWLHVKQQLTDGCVVLILLLQLETRRQLTLATKTNLAWLPKSATDRKMLGLLVVRSAYII